MADILNIDNTTNIELSCPPNDFYINFLVDDNTVETAYAHRMLFSNFKNCISGTEGELPTFQRTIINGNALSEDNEILGGGTNFTWSGIDVNTTSVLSNFIIRDENTLNDLVNFSTTGLSAFSNPSLNTPTFQFGGDGSLIQYGNDGISYWTNKNTANTGDYIEYIRNGSTTFTSTTSDNDAYRRYGNDSTNQSLLYEKYYDGTTYQKVTAGISGASFFADELDINGSRVFSSINATGDDFLQRLRIGASGSDIDRITISNADLYLGKVPDVLTSDYVILAQETTTGKVGQIVISAPTPPIKLIVDETNAPISNASTWQNDNLIGLGTINNDRITIIIDAQIQQNWGNNISFTFDNTLGQIDISPNTWQTGSSVEVSLNQ